VLIYGVIFLGLAVGFYGVYEYEIKRPISEENLGSGGGRPDDRWQIQKIQRHFFI
jgi:hypothetical protein